MSLDISSKVVSILKDPLCKKENVLQKVAQYLSADTIGIQDYSVDILLKRNSSDYETYSDSKMYEPTESTICFSNIQSCTIVIHVNWRNMGMKKYVIMNIEVDPHTSFGVN